MRLLDWLSPPRYEIPQRFVPEPQSRFALVGSAIADASGRAQVDFQGPPRGQTWYVETAGVTGGTLVVFYKNSEEPRNNFNMGEPSPNVLDRNRVYRIWTGERIIVIFTGAAIGARCTVHMEGAVGYGDA